MLNKYLEFLEEEKFVEADKYIENMCPTTLFKFISLGTSKDKQKFLTLKNEEVWFANATTFNDPFEYKGLYIDEARFSEKDSSYFLKSVWRNIFSVNYSTAFCEDALFNYPMWAHYANNHKGFCIEFESRKNNHLMPVLYSAERINLTEQLWKEYQNEYLNPQKIREYSSDFPSIVEIFNSNTDNPYRPSEKILRFIALRFLLKQEKWNYEKEWRFVLSNRFLKNVNSPGRSYKYSDLGLKVKAIYLGINCSATNREKLKRIAWTKGWKIFQLELDDRKFEFKSPQVEILHPPKKSRYLSFKRFFVKPHRKSKSIPNNSSRGRDK